MCGAHDDGPCVCLQELCAVAAKALAAATGAHSGRARQQELLLSRAPHLVKNP